MAVNQRLCYRELSSCQIRILHLAPGSTTDELSGGLEIVDVGDASEYIALSYAWGTRMLEKRLFLPAPISITTTLWSALHRLRSPSNTLRIWADAICINQTNDQEKASQVMAMRMVFQNAKMVVADLGEESDGSEVLSPMLAAIPNMRDMSKHKLGDFIPMHSYPDDEGTTKTALIKVLSRNWFKRCWIFQEAIVASDIDIMCGNWRHPWECLLYATMSLDIGTEHSDQSELRRTQARIQHMNAMRAKVKRKEQITLTAALFYNRHSTASDPRDHVYAMLGLCGLEREVQLRPNYTEDSPATFLRYGQWLVQHGLAIHLLYLNHPSMQSDNLPSWICDWSKTPDEDGGHETILFALDPPVFAAGTLKFPSIRLQGPQSIVAKGVMLSKIQEVGKDPIAAKRIITERDSCMATTMLYGMNFQNFLKSPDMAGDLPDIISSFNDHMITLSGFRKRLRESCPVRKFIGAASISGPSSCQVQTSESVVDRQRVDHCASSALICKADGLIGQVPRGTIVGDVIIVLHGSQVPFVVRPIGNLWKFVGAAYVEDMMDGEAMENPEFTTTDFLIV
jgi:hypothetical protein